MHSCRRGKNAMCAGVCMHGTRRSMQAQWLMARAAVLCSTNLHLKLVLHVQRALEHGGLLLVKHPAAQRAQHGFSLHLSACPHSARCAALVRAGHRTGTAHRLPALPPTHPMAAALRRGRPAAPVLGWPSSPAAAFLPPATLAPPLCPPGGSLGLALPCGHHNVNGVHLPLLKLGVLHLRSRNLQTATVFSLSKQEPRVKGLPPG